MVTYPFISVHLGHIFDWIFVKINLPHKIEVFFVRTRFFCINWIEEWCRCIIWWQTKSLYKSKERIFLWFSVPLTSFYPAHDFFCQLILPRDQARQKTIHSHVFFGQSIKWNDFNQWCNFYLLFGSKKICYHLCNTDLKPWDFSAKIFSR